MPDTSEIPRVVRREDAKKGRQRQTWVFPFQAIWGFGRNFKITKTFCLMQMKTNTGLSPISQPQEVYASLSSFPLEIRNIRTQMDFLWRKSPTILPPNTATFGGWRFMAFDHVSWSHYIVVGNFLYLCVLLVVLHGGRRDLISLLPILLVISC